MTGSVSVDTTPADWRSLRGIPLLTTLTDDGLRTLWSDTIPLRRPAGQVLRHAGDPATHLLLLLDGRVSATAVVSSGRTVRFGEWNGPCALDKVAVIDGRGHTAIFTTLTPCTMRSLPRERFLALVDSVSSVRQHVLHVLAHQARHHQQQHLATTTMPTEARISAWLLKETAAARGTPVPLPGSQQVLADLLGVTRVTVNRALTKLRRDGLIDIQGHTITVLAPELLQLRAGV